MPKITLTAHVSHRPNKTGKVKILSDVLIRLDGKKALAFKTLGGKFTSSQALQEFKRRYNEFAPEAGQTVDSVALAALAA